MRVGRPSRAMTLAIVKVFPEPVTPRSVVAGLPSRIESTICRMASGWSPVGWYGAVSSKSIFFRLARLDRAVSLVIVLVLCALRSGSCSGTVSLRSTPPMLRMGPSLLQCRGWHGFRSNLPPAQCRTSFYLSIISFFYCSFLRRSLRRPSGDILRGRRRFFRRSSYGWRGRRASLRRAGCS